MLFNSLAFFIFFPLVTVLFFLLPHRVRWALLLTASCGFYMYFIPKYILILGFTIVVDYFAGILIENAVGRRRRWYLTMSICANVGVLALFKYFNFINDNVAELARMIGWNYSIQALRLALPIGLSFHTFQAMSYTIEVYRGHQKAERHFGIYALYVMFYPQLVAGPIERPQNLLHQFHEHHYFDYSRVTSGLKLMAWGLFKKTVVADRLAVLVNRVYADPSACDGATLLLATLCFAYQIYCDFSGYSDIAIGSAQVMGFRLMDNFNRPYHARSVAEFWRRWHISLSTWFRDYLYYPLGGNRVPSLRWGRNILIVFLVSGLWHGANWTYVIWGALHGLYLLFGAASAKLRDQLSRAVGLTRFARAHSALRLVLTFLLVCVAWIFFRATSVTQAAQILRGTFHGWRVALLHPRQWVGFHVVDFRWLAISAIIILFTEAFEGWRARAGTVTRLQPQPWWLRWSFYYALVFAILMLHTPEAAQFIYFQF